MNELNKFLHDTKEIYEIIYNNINDFAVTYKYVSSMPAGEVRKLLLSVLDQIDNMLDAGKDICEVMKKKEDEQAWSMSLEEFNYLSYENN